MSSSGPRSAGSRVRRDRRSLVATLRTVSPPVVAVLLLLAAALWPDPDVERRPPRQVAVMQSSYACPAGSGVTIGAGQLSAGASARARLVPGGTPVPDLADADRWRNARVKGDAVIVEQRGRGSGPVGFFATTAAKKDGGGLSVGSCPSVVDDGWYLGLGSGAKHQSTLVLTNLASSQAVVDVDLWNSRGRVDAVDADGIVVDPFSTRRVDLADLAAGERELAVHVTRRRGSLSVLALDSSTAVFRGNEPVGSTLPPARTSVVVGVPRDEDGRTLMVLNPGSRTARVKVRVSGAKGTFAPEGLASVKVGAGRLKVVEVPRSAGSGAVALWLTSDQPVAAAVRAAPSTTDLAYAEAVPALDGTAILPVALGPDVAPPDLVLTASRRRADVHVEAYDASMQRVATHDVEVPEESTQRLDLGSAKVLDADDIAYVTVRSTGTVRAAAVYRDGERISSLALSRAPVTVLGPQVGSTG